MKKMVLMFLLLTCAAFAQNGTITTGGTPNEVKDFRGGGIFRKTLNIPVTDTDYFPNVDKLGQVRISPTDSIVRYFNGVEWVAFVTDQNGFVTQSQLDDEVEQLQQFAIDRDTLSIPLAGTPTGKPVTGVIQTNAPINFMNAPAQFYDTGNFRGLIAPATGSLVVGSGNNIDITIDADKNLVLESQGVTSNSVINYTGDFSGFYTDNSLITRKNLNDGLAGVSGSLTLQTVLNNSPSNAIYNINGGVLGINSPTGNTKYFTVREAANNQTQIYPSFINIINPGAVSPFQIGFTTPTSGNAFIQMPGGSYLRYIGNTLTATRNNTFPDADGVFLVAGNTKTVGGQSLVGSGNVTEIQNSLTASTVLGPSVDAVNTALALKANLASPALTGTPTAPTATAGTNTTQLATTAFATTADNLKVNKSGDTMTGTLNTIDVLPTTTGVGNVGSASKMYANVYGSVINTANIQISASEVVFRSNTFTALARLYNGGNWVIQTGGTFNDNGLGKIQVTGQIYVSDAPTNANHTATKGYVDGFQTVSAATTAQTAATLNAAYPSAPVFYRVYAPAVGSGMIYVKTSAGGQWLAQSCTTLNP